MAVFPGARVNLSGKRPRRHEKVKLVFKPVNKQLQSVLQVCCAASDCTGTGKDTVHPVHRVMDILGGLSHHS